MKTRLFLLVTVLMMLFTGSAFADVAVGSVTRVRNTDDGPIIAIYTQEGYSVGSIDSFVVDKPLKDGNVIEAINGVLTKPGKVRILDEHTHSADNYVVLEYTHLTKEAAERWLSNNGRFGDVQRGSVTGIRSTSDGTKIAIFTQEGYSVGTILEYVAAKPMEDGNIIEAINGFLTDTGKVRILDEHTHSADNYVQIEAVYLSEEAANRWLAKGGRF